VNAQCAGQGSGAAANLGTSQGLPSEPAQPAVPGSGGAANLGTNQGLPTEPAQPSPTCDNPSDSSGNSVVVGSSPLPYQRHVHVME
jgi:hypothetical protein